MKRLEVDISKLQRRDQKRSQSQRKLNDQNKSHGDVAAAEKRRSRSPLKSQRRR